MRKIITLTLALILISVSLVTAFGVSSPHWKNNPLKMYPGESKTINFNLQNMVGNEDVTVKADLKKGIDIAKLEEDTYTVEAGTSDTQVPLNIKFPENPGEKNEIEVEFKTLTSGGGGGVTMGTGMTISFDVLTIAKTEETEQATGTFNWAIILGIAALLIVIFIILIIKKRTQ